MGFVLAIALLATGLRPAIPMTAQRAHPAGSSARFCAQRARPAGCNARSSNAHRPAQRARRTFLCTRMGAGVTRGEGFQVETNANVEIIDARLFSQLKVATVGLACCSALQLSSGGGRPWAEVTTLWWLISRAAKVLSGAAQRGRLAASTFQLLNAGIIAALVCDVVAATRLSPADLLGIVASRAFLAVPSWRALRRYGFPRAALLFPLSRPAEARNALAVSYALLGTSSASALAASICGKLPAAVSALQLVPAAALLALRSAALAGPKRLASPTYMQLNRALQTFALAGVVADAAMLGWRGPLGGPTLWVRARFLWACALALVCREGYKRGASYTEPSPGSDISATPIIDVKVIEC